MTWLAGVVFDCTAAIMASESLGTMLPCAGRIPIDGCQILPIFSMVLKIDRHQGAVADLPPIIARRREFGRWQPPLFMLLKTTGMGSQIAREMMESAEPVRLSCRRHVRGSMPVTEAGA